MTEDDILRAAMKPDGIDAALDAIQAKMRELGEHPIDWRKDMPPKDQDDLRAVVLAGIASALRLDALAGLVEAGKEPFELWIALGSQRNIDTAQAAYHGDMNAAVRLVEVLLPGWRVSDCDQDTPGNWYWTLSPLNGKHEIQHAGGPNPARALLLATLRAKMGEGEV